MGKGLFITGTDTGVGKTLVACGLASLLKEAGYRVGVMKPAETGCEEREGTLVPLDALALKEISGCEAPLQKICPYPLRDPLAPAVAAQRDGVKIDFEGLMDIYNEIRTSHDVTLVEGAGGLMVPLVPSYTYADFARVLKLPMLVVATNKLGVINHLLLTLEHASCQGLRALGYVLNHVEPMTSLAAETNRETLWSLTSVPCLGEIPFVSEIDVKRSDLSALLKAHMDLDWLERYLRNGTGNIS